MFQSIGIMILRVKRIKGSRAVYYYLSRSGECKVVIVPLMEGNT